MGLIYQESKWYFWSLFFIGSALQFKSKLQCWGWWLSATTVPPPKCQVFLRLTVPLLPSPARHSLHLLPLPGSRTWPLCTALIHPSSSSGWETDAFRLPAWSVTVCLASASSFPTPDVSTWCCSKLCQASSQQGMYLLLLLQRWLWCSVFYSFLPDPLFCSSVCTLLPTQDLFFNSLQFLSPALTFPLPPGSLVTSPPAHLHLTS